MNAHAACAIIAVTAVLLVNVVEWCVVAAWRKVATKLRTEGYRIRQREELSVCADFGNGCTAEARRLPTDLIQLTINGPQHLPVRITLAPGSASAAYMALGRALAEPAAPAKH